MITNTQVRTRSHSLAVQRAQAEERRQRLEEQWYELEVKKNQLEGIKIDVDVLKHQVTVTTAIFLIVSYFGPAMQARLGSSLVGAGLIILLYSLLATSLLGSFMGLILASLATDDNDLRFPIRVAMAWFWCF